MPGADGRLEVRTPSAPPEIVERAASAPWHACQISARRRRAHRKAFDDQGRATIVRRLHGALQDIKPIWAAALRRVVTEPGTVDTGDPVLVLSDLGHFDPRQSQVWVRPTRRCTTCQQGWHEANTKARKRIHNARLSRTGPAVKRRAHRTGSRDAFPLDSASSTP